MSAATKSSANLCYWALDEAHMSLVSARHRAIETGDKALLESIQKLFDEMDKVRTTLLGKLSHRDG